MMINKIIKSIICFGILITLLTSCDFSSSDSSNSENPTIEPTVQPTIEKKETLKFKLNDDQTSYIVTGYIERTEEVII